MVSSFCQIPPPLWSMQLSKVTIPHAQPTFPCNIQEKWDDGMLDGEGIADRAAKETCGN